MLTKEQIAYGQQKNREYMYKQAQLERQKFKKDHNDFSIWDEFDVAWTDYRYMDLCDQANITPW